MIRVRIGSDERDMTESVDEHWINQQINRRRHEGQQVCVQVTVREPGVDAVLSSPGCGSPGGGGRPPNVEEREIFDLWNQRGLNRADFTGGNLVAFLKQLRSLVTR